ncbi:hypothetical protein IFM89_010492 [Coptis chinensis]|uniref:J domain-containing protein n=1 Tax=Coptis chinensis TaxID=261450 RepID=A0A835GVT1_9MAGN|nr:hypothetical protein IFM89_010492 [Coptis chinensis]
MLGTESLLSFQTITTKQVLSKISSSPTVKLKKPAANLYEVLKLKRSASPAEIKKAYMSLVKQFQPDAKESEADSRDFIEIHNAYSTV